MGFLIFICWIVIHPVGSTIQCLSNWGQHVCSQHSFGLPLRMHGMHRTQFDHACLDHPRGPRGSQSCRVKRRNKSFQAWAEPLGTDSHRTISKRSRECWFLTGHKKCFVLLCPIGEQFLLRVVFSTLFSVFHLVMKQCISCLIYYFPNQKRRNYG